MRAPPVLIILAMLLLAGCAAPAADRSATQERLASAVGAGSAATASPITFSTPVHLGDVLLGSEPSVAVATDGTAYVGSPGDALYRSDDAGLTWKGLGRTYCADLISVGGSAGDLCPIKSSDPGKDGGGDTSLVVGPDGTLYHLGLSGNAGSIPFQVSVDKGNTFRPAIDLAYNHSTDRQWIMMDGAGVLHASWRDLDYGTVVERHSADKGVTWSPLLNVTEDGHQGPIAADPTTGTLYLPHVKGHEIWTAISHDGGNTWTDRKAAQSNTDTFDFPIAAVDSAGTVYVTYNTDPTSHYTVLFEGITSVPQVFLVASKDGGLTWTKPVAVSPKGIPAMFPWMAAGSAGRVVIAWYEGTLGTPSDRTPNAWHVAVAISLDADQAKPTFQETYVSENVNHVGGICLEGLLCNLSGGDRSLLDFFEVRILPDGSPVLAFAGDSTAYQAFTAVYATRMTSGPSLYG